MIGGSGSSFGKLRKGAGSALIISLLAAVYLNIFLVPAYAGTETGEFCPTCPDWTNLDGWLAQKEAYERAQANSAQANQRPVEQQCSGGECPHHGRKEYPQQEMLTHLDLVRNGQIILDVRTPEEYQSGHVSGARNLYWKELQKGGSLGPAGARVALSKAGVNDSDHIVIYGGSDVGRSSPSGR